MMMNEKSKLLLSLILLIVVCFLSDRPANAIKVGLYTDCNDPVFIGVAKGGVIGDLRTDKYILVLSPMKPYKLRKAGDYMVITIDEKEYRIDSNEIIIRSTSEKDFVYTKRRWYRGNLIVRNTSSGMTVINDLEVEDYIKGVVPAEMPSAWNIEAHKAQAIAARSYALANLGKRGSHGYDLKDTPEDQAYSGATGETVQTNRAVELTRGQVLVYNDKIIPAYYHASSGGWTSSAKSVWGKDLPFTEPVRSFDDELPQKGHGVGMSQNGANFLANKGYNAYQILGYFYHNVLLRRLESN